MYNKTLDETSSTQSHNTDPKIHFQRDTGKGSDKKGLI